MSLLDAATAEPKSKCWVTRQSEEIRTELREVMDAEESGVQVNRAAVLRALHERGVRISDSPFRDHLDRKCRCAR